MSISQFPYQVFVSYSRNDKEIAQKIVKDLQENHIPAWIDTSNIELGSPDWEKTIKNALKDSFAIIWVASPNSKASNNVEYEVKIAERGAIRVIPAWVDGDNWLEVCWFGASKMQYEDCRPDKYTSGIKRVIRQLKLDQDALVPQHIEVESANSYIPSGFLTVQLNKNRTIALRAASYPNFESLSRDVYEYIFDDYPPYKYGLKWILAHKSNSRGFRRVAVPSEWFSAFATGKSLIEVNKDWAGNISLPDFGLFANTQWKVDDPSQLPIYGIACNNKLILDALLRDTKLVALLENVNCVSPTNWQDVKFDNFAYATVVSGVGLIDPIRIFTQILDVLPQDLIRHLQNTVEN